MSQILGLEQLRKDLNELPFKLERNVWRGAARAAGKPLQKIARDMLRLHKGTGKLAKGITIRTETRGRMVYSHVMTSGPHAHVGKWLEYGVRAHSIALKNKKALHWDEVFARSAHSPGFGEKPFMRPALDGGAEQALIEAVLYTKDRLATKEGLNTAYIEVIE